MSDRTPVNISSFTIYQNSVEEDDLFNVYAGAILALGHDNLSNDAMAGAGLARFWGASAIDDGLALAESVTLANAAFVTQNAGDLSLGATASDAATARNIAGATWDLTDAANITGAGASKFVNLGVLEQTSGASTVSANFYDHGGSVQVDGTLNFTGPIARFVDDSIGGSGTVSMPGVLVNTKLSVDTLNLLSVRIVGDVEVTSRSSFGSDVNIAAGAVLDFANAFARLTEVVGPGKLQFTGNDGVFTNGCELVGAVTLENFGDTSFIGMITGYTFGMSIRAIPQAGQHIDIINHAGAVWTVSGDTAQFSTTNPSGATFYNEGDFENDTRVRTHKVIGVNGRL